MGDGMVSKTNQKNDSPPQLIQMQRSLENRSLHWKAQENWLVEQKPWTILDLISLHWILDWDCMKCHDAQQHMVVGVDRNFMIHKHP